MSTTVTLRVDDDTYRDFARRARAENRSLSNFIETAVKEHLRHGELVDDFEMAEIQANKPLVERLRKGSQDARKRRGTMVG